MIAKKKRIWELDFWRGLAIMLVVFDHAFYDYARIFSVWANCGVDALEWLNEISISYLNSDVRLFWRPSFLFLFFCVAGLCTALSKNNLLRGIKLWTVACLVSAVTYIIDKFSKGTFVLLGVLHCLAIVILIYAAIDYIIKGGFLLGEKITNKRANPTLRAVINAIVLLAIAVVFYFINHNYNARLIDMTLNSTVSELDGKKFGWLFYSREWWTADYFPVFPFISFFFFGAALSKILYKEKKTLFPKLDGCWHNVFTLAGRHSLGVYLFGQVVAMGLGVILSLILLGDAILF